MKEYSCCIQPKSSPSAFRLTESDGFLTEVAFLRDGTPDAEEATTPVLKETIRQLTAYINGGLTQFDLPMKLIGTSFQKRVWEALYRVPFGQTVTYGELARIISNPGAMRAVGTALGRNPIPVIIPCHRVLAHGGRIGGFSGGLDIKRWLLAHEGIQIAP